MNVWLSHFAIVSMITEKVGHCGLWHSLFLPWAPFCIPRFLVKVREYSGHKCNNNCIKMHANAVVITHDIPAIPVLLVVRVGPRSKKSKRKFGTSPVFFRGMWQSGRSFT